MMVASRRSVCLRSVAVWCAVSAGVAVTAALTVPSMAPGGRLAAGNGGFADLLVTGCSLASLVAATWLWAITTEVVVRVLASGGAGEVVVRRPRGARLVLLAACGVVALGGPAAAAGPGHHDDRPGFAARALAGLPLPDRATSDAALARRAQAERPAAVHHVRPGDSLWAIAEERLGPRASVGDVAAYWHRIYARNAAVIGADPDLILPGQVLELPPPG